MNQSCPPQFPTSAAHMSATMDDPNGINPQTALLDTFFPGFSLLSSVLLKYLKIDLTRYLPTILALGAIVFASQYVKDWIWEFAEMHLMSTADIRIDDEMYNMIMGWIANQQFAKRSRRFVANTNLNSRMWFLWREYDEEEEEDNGGIEFDEDSNPIASGVKGKKEKKVQFTPSFGTHYFWYKKKLLLFKRQQDPRQQSYGPVSEREEISISSFGRNPGIIKELLEECRAAFVKSDENKTVIYRGGLKSGASMSEPSWTRCVSKASRPFSTVVLDEQVKQSLLTDMRDYLHPYTRRWYSNRGIPYRRGYLLYGPPGTGKSSLSFAIAGYFKLKIYIVSLNSPSMNEENLGTLFSELPKQCVVLLEDIDTAGLTHTRDAAKPVAVEPETTDSDEAKPLVTVLPGASAAPPPPPTGRISLSALLNILDGVASQEGRVLIMTTNHIDKLDEALIRPGRVDMTVKFDLANGAMITTIFRSIFATLEGDVPPPKPITSLALRTPGAKKPSAEAEKADADQARADAAEVVRKQREEEARIARLGTQMADLIPAMMFSPAEIQGYFLKWKRDPEGAVGGAREWVEKMRVEKGKKMAEEEEEEKKKREEEEESKKKEEEEAAATGVFDEAWSVAL